MVKPEEEEERVKLLESPEPDLYLQHNLEEGKPFLSSEIKDRFSSRFNRTHAASGLSDRGAKRNRTYTARGLSDQRIGGMSSDENSSPESSLKVLLDFKPIKFIPYA